jgi:tRNA(Arg) A34 adenosine deaminase TadA
VAGAGALVSLSVPRRVLAAAVNNPRANPILHGEVACTNREACLLYTAAEPSPICMSALASARIG